jgi:hypothetical protein
MLQLLGGAKHGGVTLTSDEFNAVKKLYGYVPEKPNKKPEPPQAPRYTEYSNHWDYTKAVQDHKQALEAHSNWTDPKPLLQAGAYRNAFRHAEADGLRLLAWVAKYVEPGEDPVKTLIQFACEAGVDVDPADVDWANGNENNEGSDTE